MITMAEYLLPGGYIWWQFDVGKRFNAECTEQRRRTQRNRPNGRELPEGCRVRRENRCDSGLATVTRRIGGRLPHNHAGGELRVWEPPLRMRIFGVRPSSFSFDRLQNKQAHRHPQSARLGSGWQRKTFAASHR